MKTEQEIEIRNTLIQLVGEQISDPFTTSLVTDETNLKYDLDFDSLDKVEFCMRVERKFNIDISDSEMNNVQLFGDVVTCVQSKLN